MKMSCNNCHTAEQSLKFPLLNLNTGKETFMIKCVLDIGNFLSHILYVQKRFRTLPIMSDEAFCENN